MLVHKIFRRFIKASALIAVVFVMQGCDGSPFRLEMPRIIKEKTEMDTTPSEDLKFAGFGDEDWNSLEDLYIE